MDFLILNGEVLSKEEADLTEFLWDEPFIISQKVWFGFGGIPLFFENIESIKNQFDTFNLTLPHLFKNKRELFRLTKRMLNKNKFYRSGFITYQFFISDTNINSLITSNAFSGFDFPVTTQGLLVNFSDYKKNSNLTLNAFKCHNQYLWQAVKKATAQTGLHSSILLNENNVVCEGPATNIFMIKDDMLVTPSANAGCYRDVLRSIILAIAKSLKLKVIETSEFTKDHLFEMDEVFFASEENGIQWVLGIDRKRFVHQLTDKIYLELNHFLENKVAG